MFEPLSIASGSFALTARTMTLAAYDWCGWISIERTDITNRSKEKGAIFASFPMALCFSLLFNPISFNHAGFERCHLKFEARHHTRLWPRHSVLFLTRITNTVLMSYDPRRQFKIPCSGAHSSQAEVQRGRLKAILRGHCKSCFLASLLMTAPDAPNVLLILPSCSYQTSFMARCGELPVKSCPFSMRMTSCSSRSTCVPGGNKGAAGYSEDSPSHIVYELG